MRRKTDPPGPPVQQLCLKLDAVHFAMLEFMSAASGSRTALLRQALEDFVLAQPAWNLQRFGQFAQDLYAADPAKQQILEQALQGLAARQQRRLPASADLRIASQADHFDI